MFNPYIIIGIIAVIISSDFYFYSKGISHAETKAALEMQMIQRQHAQALADQAAKTLEAERAATLANQQIDIVKNEAEQKINHDLSVNLAAAKRLRFKATIARCRPLPKADTPGKSVEPAEEHQSIELPRPIEANLFRLAAEADRLRVYGEACHRWAASISEVITKKVSSAPFNAP